MRTNYFGNGIKFWERSFFPSPTSRLCSFSPFCLDFFHFLPSLASLAYSHLKKMILLCISNVYNYFIFYLYLQNLIDLAGSESSKAETTGMRRKEGSYINKSLLTLGTVRPQALCWSSIFGIQSVFVCLYFWFHYKINFYLSCFGFFQSALSVYTFFCYYYAMFMWDSKLVYYVCGSWFYSFDGYLKWSFSSKD